MIHDNGNYEKSKGKWVAYKKKNKSVRIAKKGQCAKTGRKKIEDDGVGLTKIGYYRGGQQM